MWDFHIHYQTCARTLTSQDNLNKLTEDNRRLSNPSTQSITLHRKHIGGLFGPTPAAAISLFRWNILQSIHTLTLSVNTLYILVCVCAGSFTVWGTTSIWTCLCPSCCEPGQFWPKTRCCSLRLKPQTAAHNPHWWPHKHKTPNQTPLRSLVIYIF